MTNIKLVLYVIAMMMPYVITTYFGYMAAKYVGGTLGFITYAILIVLGAILTIRSACIVGSSEDQHDK